MTSSISTYVDSVTTIKIVDRTANLSDAYFPSVIICNINQLRKSFIYWLHENINQEWPQKYAINVDDVFSLVRKYYFRATNNDPFSQTSDDFLNLILDSNFFETKFLEFLGQNLDNNDTQEALMSIIPPKNKIASYYDFKFDAEGSLGQYGNLTKVAYHKNFFQALANQWAIGQMILMMRWQGRLGRNSWGGNLFYSIGYPTDFGVCQWITPNYQFSGSDAHIFQNLPRGALNGVNNGLSLLMDAETFDYGDGSSTGVGFKIAVVYPTDIGVIESTAISVDIGQVTQVGVSTTLTGIDDDAVSSIDPNRRKCWMQEEIELQHYPKSDDFRFIV